jgi:uncharacterized Ntn-hydrolase superfamily protein
MTYSIVARDQDTGLMGVAVQSHWFSVGSVVTWGEAGVGVVATQAFANPSYGPLGLDLMRDGVAAPEALASLLERDGGADTRQVAMVDASGAVGVHTGVRCIAGAGHVAGDGYSVQANMMLTETVPDAMSAAFEGASGDLVDRLLAALDAAEAAGGDVRGRQSAAILVVGAEPAEQHPALARLLELRVEDHPDPLTELGRLVAVKRAYEHMNQGDVHLGRGEMDEAASEYEAAQSSVPDNVEFTFWRGVTLATTGRIDEARPFLERAFRAPTGHWRDLLERLPAAGVMPEDVLRKVSEKA